MGYAEIFSALADPTRRSIFESLREHPKTAGELAESQPVSRPAVSQHLRVLQTARLIGVEPLGNRRLYFAEREGLEELRRYVDEFWGDALSAFGDEIRKRKKKK